MEEILLLILIVGVKGQFPMKFNLPPKPDRCNRPAEFMYRQCCIFPPFFTREIARKCGATMSITNADKVNNFIAYVRLPSTTCEHWACVLDLYGLLLEDFILDDEKYFSHLDRWVDLNPEFKTVIMNGKVFCKNLYRMSLPLRVCDFYDFHACIRNFVVADCPATIPSKECKEVKEFYDECREFYI